MKTFVFWIFSTLFVLFYITTSIAQDCPEVFDDKFDAINAPGCKADEVGQSCSKSVPSSLNTDLRNRIDNNERINFFNPQRKLVFNRDMIPANTPYNIKGKALNKKHKKRSNKPDKKPGGKKPKKNKGKKPKKPGRKGPKKHGGKKQKPTGGDKENGSTESNKESICCPYKGATQFKDTVFICYP